MNLAGRTVALTRPAGRNEPWAEALNHARAAVEHYPLLEIEAIAGPVSPAADSVDGMIFISPTAAEIALDRLIPEHLPLDHQIIAAVGEGTAAAIRKQLCRTVICPAGAGGSESLLEIMPPVAEQSWMIVRGEGGRDLLQHTLEERGARVAFWDVYRRMFDQAHGRRLLNNLDRIDAIVFSSSEALRGLCAHAAGADELQRLQSKLIVVFHPRIARTAEDLGFKTIQTAANAEHVPTLLGECLQRRE